MDNDSRWIVKFITLFKEIGVFFDSIFKKITGQSAIGGPGCGLFVDSVQWGEVSADGSYMFLIYECKCMDSYDIFVPADVNHLFKIQVQVLKIFYMIDWD